MAAGLVLGLAACAGGLHSDAKPTQVYVLRAPSVAKSASGDPASASIQIARPLARPGLASDHIVLVEPDHRMSYYVASRWPAPLPDVVEALELETLRNSGGWKTVQDSSSAFSSDYLLQIVIQRFEADYPGRDSPAIHVTLDCTLGKRTDREIVASFTAQGSAVASANRLAEVVSAFETASSQALASIAEQSLRAVQATQNREAPVPSMTRYNQ